KQGMRMKILSLPYICILCLQPGLVFADKHEDTFLMQSVNEQMAVADNSLVNIVEYSAAFFSLYQPSTALDMVQQLPGFQINDGDRTRGFAAAAGNILINGRRLSAKQ